MEKQLKRAEFTDGTAYETKDYNAFIENPLLDFRDSGMLKREYRNQFKDTIDNTLEAIGDYVQEYAKLKYDLEHSTSDDESDSIEDSHDNCLIDELKSRGYEVFNPGNIISETFVDRFLKILQVANHVEIEVIINDLELSLKIK